MEALADYFRRLEDIMAFIDLRSYGQMGAYPRPLGVTASVSGDMLMMRCILRVIVSTPYSYSCNVVPPDEEDMLEAAHGAAAALRLVHGTPMKVCVRGLHRLSPSFHVQAANC